jgi:hypothetical protein
LLAGCSFEPRIPDGTVVCGASGECPAGTSCVSPPKGSGGKASGPALCCRDSLCSGRYAPAKDASGPVRAPDAGAPRPPEDPAAPTPDDAATGIDVAASGSEAGALDLSRPAEDVAPADTTAIDTRPVEPPPQDDPSLATGIKAYLRFDDAPQNQTWRDSSGNGNAATLHVADVQASWTDGRYDRGCRLAGGIGGGWLEMPAANSFNDIVHGLSISAWILRTPEDRGDGTVLARRSSSGSGQLYALDIVGDRLRIRLNTAGGYNANLSAGDPLPHGRWVHVAMTYDEHMVRLFVDGLERASMPYGLGLPPEITPVMVGAAEPGTGGSPISRLAGTLDEVLLYGRALANRDVSALAARARPPAAK